MRDALTAPLDRDAYATEPEPIFWRTMLAHNAARIVADVSAGLDWSAPTLRVVEPPIVCETCKAISGHECRTSSGRKARWHAGRRSA